MAITVGLSLYTTRLVLNALGVNDFGIFNLVGGAVMMLTFLNNSMAAATQRFMSYTEGSGDLEKLKTIFNVSIVSHLAVGGVVFMLMELIGYILFDGVLSIPAERIEAAKWVYQFTVVSTLVTIISVPYDAVINAHENMLFYGIIGILEAVLKLSIAIYIANSTHDQLITYGLLMAVSTVFTLYIRRIYCHRHYSECEIYLRKHFSKPLFKEMTSFAGWSLLGSSTSMITGYGQGILINTFFGTSVNAAQAIAGQVNGQLGAFGNTMLKALNPVIAKSEGAGNRELMLKASAVGNKVAFFLLMIFYIPMLVEAPFVLKIWLDNVPDYTITFCQLALIRSLLEQLTITFSSSISAVGNIRKFQIYSSILAASPLVITYIFFKYEYPVYALYIVLITYTIMSSVVLIYFTHKLCGLVIEEYLKDTFLRCIVSFIIVICCAGIITYSMNESSTRFFLVGLTTVLTYSIAVYKIGFTINERALIRKNLKYGPILTGKEPKTI
ncbi:hypothetical protein [Spirosoma utsteinense]|uniref:O-antigen/teichoic acid export membrane protein n=1 Tax=Spirosoma utsteinense TaxID=2585773 RepID=A0ABR6WEN8_9BACT|nr:hypothetical protein [Spirosoma utsteinense]MBC3789114.1 O-antigen/teichoic acid export membrane protein [Spirosoma utsteinense]MBC3795020.1 O-antigen/teichoic acid export membrane protein [Spirosoma utsteinense]